MSEEILDSGNFLFNQLFFNLLFNLNNYNYYKDTEEENSVYSLSELEKKIKNESQDIRLQYTAQYLWLVESGLTKAQASSTISTSLNHGPWTAHLIQS